MTPFLTSLLMVFQRDLKRGFRPSGRIRRFSRSRGFGDLRRPQAPPQEASASGLHYPFALALTLHFLSDRAERKVWFLQPLHAPLPLLPFSMC